jgi:hypothetical protein
MSSASTQSGLQDAASRSSPPGESDVVEGILRGVDVYLFVYSSLFLCVGVCFIDYWVGTDRIVIIFEQTFQVTVGPIAPGDAVATPSGA